MILVKWQQLKELKVKIRIWVRVLQ
ncbi:unnamed protein product [Arabidopsis thaliana]|uniref:Uncharacterized protein n=2 Tax=Arabidopsis thaliana TaxID=3702 RepID=A0A1P8B165_ARATH|nr:uncharacterized protein AT2G29925 [Arabidopsis thaliana]ANM62655.1 hypothetical protein AT2G29925 [Arabidopsis thaliana]VYS53936.1 unnamed protein product [Arabidopsis thaliana]|eukprot:NP_001324797.1 hypothetical protein AT2G29925 [Arabidopsis thaliana]